jgi:tetrahydromethanopterin S-methyltransferase subunit G
MNATQKLLEIHEIVSDAATFIKIRSFLEELESKKDNVSAKALLECLNKVHATCVFIRNMEK